MNPPDDAQTSADTLLGGRLRLFQPRRGYRVAIDPVLLAAAVAADAGERVLDAGAGTGAASLCLAARVPGCVVTGVERDPELLALATTNVRANGLEGRITVAAGDLTALPAGLRATTFDRVMTNLPTSRSAAPARRGPTRRARRTARLCRSASGSRPAWRACGHVAG